MAYTANQLGLLGLILGGKMESLSLDGVYRLINRLETLQYTLSNINIHNFKN